MEVATTSVGNGLCVSRYDVTLTTHAMTTLSYQETPVLAEITLLREGGLTGGSPGVHAENVTHGLVQYRGSVHRADPGRQQVASGSRGAATSFFGANASFTCFSIDL